MYPDVPDAPQPTGPSGRRHATLRYRTRSAAPGGGAATTHAEGAANAADASGAAGVSTSNGVPADPVGASPDRTFGYDAEIDGSILESASGVSLEPVLTAADTALRQTLIDCLSDPPGDDEEPNMLSSLTGVLYTALNPPDFLAVRCGSSVSGKLWGGFVTAGWVDHDGTNFSWFCAGTQPHAYVGVAVRYGARTCEEQQVRARQLAMTYLAKSIGQARDPGTGTLGISPGR
ncbi:hypothetical protein SAMN05444157_3461 [Frankineae bacterium MT45]|nr:hypothetical protein SAMN05444157_3461 [Frankineae bacterium MT45]